MASDKSKILKSAEKYVASGKSAQAIDEYVKILKDNPKDWPVKMQVGELYLKINKTAEAIEQFQQVADHYYSDGFFLKAIAIYKRINKLDPSRTDICLKLAELYLKQGLTMDAKSQLQVVAQNYLTRNQNKEAIATLKRLIEIEPDNLKTRNDLAKAFKSEGMIPEAIKEYVEISEELMRKNLLKESLAVLETANKLDPKEAGILRRILQIYSGRQETGKASSLLEDALRMDPSNAEILELVAESYAQRNDFVKAHELIDRAVLNSSKKDHLWRMKGDFYLKAQDLPQAFSQYSQAVEKLVQRKELEEAVRLLQKITKADPTFYAAWLRLTDVYSMLRQPANIIIALEGLVDAYIAKELYQEASRYVKKLIELEPEDSQHQQKQEFINSFLGKTKTDALADEEPQAAAASFSILSGKPSEIEIPKSALETPVAPSNSSASPSAPSIPVAESEEGKDFISEHLIEAEVFNKYGLIDKAMEQVQLVIFRYPDCVPAHQKLKEIHLEKGERDKAVEQCVAMSRIFRKLGDEDQAEDILSEARQINPNHPLLERAYKEIPQAPPSKSADVMGEIEKLAETIKTKSGSFKVPGPPSTKRKLPSTQSILAQLFPSGTKQSSAQKPSPSLKIPAPSKIEEAPVEPAQSAPQIEEVEVELVENEIEEKADSALPVQAFEEIDFYIGQGMKSEAWKLLQEVKEKHPEDAGVAERMKSVEAALSEASEGQPEPQMTVADEEIQIDLDEFEMTPISSEEVIEENPTVAQNELQTDLEAIEPPGSAQADSINAGTEELKAGVEETWDLSDLAQIAQAAEKTTPPDSGELEIDVEELGATEELELNAPEFTELEEHVRENSEAPAPSNVPEHDDAKIYGEAMDAIFAQQEKPIEEAAHEESVPVKAPEELFEEEDEFFDLAAELEEGFLNVQSAVEERPTDGQNYSLEQILTDFRKGVDKQVSAEDYDTRYNLGIAYKEMGLIDEAIAEFQFASKDSKRFVECCSLLGLCFMEKGMQKLAVKWYQRGLDAEGYSEDEYQGLRFELAQAYEAMGESEKALEIYQEVYGVNAGYRNVSKKIKELEQHLKKN